MSENFQNLRRFRVNKLMEYFGKLALKLTGWRVDTKTPELSKAIIIVAHHTSNWDFLVGLMASFAMKLRAFWIGKHTLFRWPLGPLMRWFGGIPVDRRAAHNVVDQVVDVFTHHKEMIIALSPEGTRKKLNHWKSGFYHMALGANVPIVCAFIDYKKKLVGLGPVLKLTGNEDRDLGMIREFYESVAGKVPEYESDIVFR